MLLMSRVMVNGRGPAQGWGINSCCQPCMSSKVVVHGPDPRCSRALQMQLQHHNFVYKTTLTEQRTLYSTLNIA